MSDTISWTASLEIGVRPIDAAHKHLIEFVNLVRTASKRQRSTLNGDRRLLNDLQALLQTHFEREEDLMFGIDYPGVNTHMTIHSTLRSDFEEKIQESVRSGDPECAVSFIAAWLVDHMKTEDTKLAAFIKSQKEANTKARAAAKAAKAAGPLKRGVATKR